MDDEDFPQNLGPPPGRQRNRRRRLPQNGAGAGDGRVEAAGQRQEERLHGLRREQRVDRPRREQIVDRPRREQIVERPRREQRVHGPRQFVAANQAPIVHAPGLRQHQDVIGQVPGHQEAGNAAGAQYVGDRQQQGRGRRNRLQDQAPNPRWNRPQDQNNQVIHQGLLQNSGDQRNHHSTKIKMQFRTLQNIVSEDSKHAFTEIINKKHSFVNLIQEQITDPGVIVLVVKLLAIVTQSSFDEQKRKFLLEICNSNFIGSFRCFLMDLPLSKNNKAYSLYWNDVQSFWDNFLMFSECIVTIAPTVAIDKCKSLIDTTTNFCLEHLKKNANFELPEELNQKLKIIQERLNKFTDMEAAELAQLSAGRRKEEPTAIDDELHEPPENFRQLSVFPSSENMLQNDFVRPNIVDGEYRDVEHYLDVQFRLLREDYIGPLRVGLTQYIANSGKGRYDNIRVHVNTKIVEPYVSFDRVGFLLQLDCKKSRIANVRWQSSKRFIYGCLLLLTNDNCRTFLFATVIDRNDSLMRQGKIPLTIVNGTRNTNYASKIPYTLIETEIYFEPYMQVLKALQDEEFPENLAMSKYIIKVQPKPSKPEYLQEDKVMLAESSGLRYKFKVLQDDTWPSAEDLGLNDSQLQAYRLALQNEFAIIQGPPGTGKTFVGLKIAETLIDSFVSQQCFMLVVCYTNHALDQFLEGILKVTDSVVRIGGQSKNPSMENINLNNLRKNAINSKSKIMAGVLHNFWDAKRNLREIVKENKDSLLQGSNYSVFSYRVFGDRVKESKIVAKCYPRSEDPLHDWLFEHLDPIPDEIFEQLLAPPEDDDFFDIGRRHGLILDDLHTSQDNYVSKIPSSFQLEQARQKLKSSCSNYLKSIKPRPGRNAAAIREEILKAEILKQQILQLLQKIDRYNSMMQLKNEKTNLKIDENNLRIIKIDDRWKIYWRWEKIIIDSRKKNETNKLQHELMTTSALYEEARMMLDLQILKSKKVIGLTTTGAARLRPLLQELAIPIVIIEEAAEVMEAHIVTALTKHCQHLILVGDHQQLRPSAANIRLARDYNTEISLFERMIMNKVHSRRLDVQHRMRPEIAALISPHIYPLLHNHPSVENFPKVRGMEANLYFLTHDFQEEFDDNSSSRKNVEEGDLVLGTANYLMQQDYKPEDITILAAYTSQMFYMKNEQKKYAFLSKVKITVVDNYQGEESKIILLSLVRNNNENKIGFLGTPNRVCVALSRAREGFFVFGNIQMLKNSSELWRDITKTLENSGALVTKLQLKCESHPDQMTSVSTLKDFEMAPEGGCLKLCLRKLNCGHNCPLICHGYNIGHVDIKCYLPCERTSCELNHKCPLACWQECLCKVPVSKTLPCGHSHQVPCYKPPDTVDCTSQIRVTLPDCGHEITIQCYQKKEKKICPKPCEFRVESCGHTCQLRCHVTNDPDHLQYLCHKPCQRLKKGCKAAEDEARDAHMCVKKCYEDCDDCTVEVKKKRPDCTHWENVPCNISVSIKPCNNSCSRLLPCEHFCQRKCSEPCGGCTVQVTKTIAECQHSVRVECGSEVSREMCQEKCSRTMSCGHVCRQRCGAPCQPAACEEPGRRVAGAPCQHQVVLPCRLSAADVAGAELLQYCSAPCPALLSCGHACSGTCSACHQGRLHLPCRQPCDRLLVCQHRCAEPCSQVCPPCKMPCRVRCPHSKCSKPCGAPCTPCQEECDNRCRHGSCSGRCGAACGRASCREPCELRLPCGHTCRGLCGDVCVDVCRLCRPDSFPRDFLGDDFDDDAKFVQLQDCGHVLELDDMDNLMSGDTETITIRLCPYCRAPILNTYRYKSIINHMIFNDINSIKEKMYGTKASIKDKKEETQNALKELKEKHEKTIQILPPLSFTYKQVHRAVNQLDRDPKLTIMQLEIHSTVLNIVNIMCDCYENLKSNAFKQVFEDLVTVICHALKNAKQKISQQQQNDISNELRRMDAIVHLEKIIIEAALSKSTDPILVAMLKEAEKAVFTWQKYDETKATKVLELLKKEAKVRVIMEERRLIVKAMGFKSGHWFKCPNGHIYCIADCGGAMVVSKCNECGARIGGTRHTLLSDNALAGEMDGAQFAAWSEEYNNMANFRFD